ncbi:ribonuclease P protein component [Thermosipho ferrireducens]|uniref:Ribonuclease P protein component n=1 Tax=Thermosipho ferrireducens TaxID=2571116 RepID=A0ABX7S6L1_9BACT|nr:ribonuclease P protein component [Thermosipho ferrireducens]QTA37523.1 ribonuclease P protein component [Thermosipho ferrireducens]
METKRLKFPKKWRLKLRKDFKGLVQFGEAVQDEFFVIIYRKNGLEYSRFGISIKKKFGKAVKRNRARRWIKECVRQNISFIPQGYDFLVITRKRFSELFEKLNYYKCCEDLLELLKRVNNEKNSTINH